MVDLSSNKQKVHDSNKPSGYHTLFNPKFRFQSNTGIEHLWPFELWVVNSGDPNTGQSNNRTVGLPEFY